VKHAKTIRTARAAPALNITSTNVPVATSKPEIKWPEPNIIDSRDNSRALGHPVCRSHRIGATPEKTARPEVRSGR
jgi:hypothetical protein